MSRITFPKIGPKHHFTPLFGPKEFFKRTRGKHPIKGTVPECAVLIYSKAFEAILTKHSKSKIIQIYTIIISTYTRIETANSF